MANKYIPSVNDTPAVNRFSDWTPENIKIVKPQESAPDRFSDWTLHNIKITPPNSYADHPVATAFAQSGLNHLLSNADNTLHNYHCPSALGHPLAVMQTIVKKIGFKPVPIAAKLPETVAMWQHPQYGSVVLNHHGLLDHYLPKP